MEKCLRCGVEVSSNFIQLLFGHIALLCFIVSGGVNMPAETELDHIRVNNSVCVEC